MNLVPILVDSLADKGLINSQMSNAREIIRRLEPGRFHVSVFCAGEPDPEIARRPNTRVVRLPRRLRTVRILREFLLGQHKILFYLKSSPASKMYMDLRQRWRDRHIAVGTIESQSDLRHEPTVAPEAVRLWERTVLRCDRLFSNSQAVQESLQREYGLPSEIIPTGVDTRFFAPDWERPPNARLRVLFAGSLRRFKQPQVLLEAAVRFPQAEYCIAGKGPMEDQLRKHIASQKLSNVGLLGELGAEQLREEYRRADIFLFPSAWEGSPKVILEAAACGLPIIARLDYRPETVLNGKTGYLVASEEELFARLAELLACPEQRSRLGIAGRKHIQSFAWDIITRRWEDVFLQLAAQKAAARAA